MPRNNSSASKAKPTFRYHVASKDLPATQGMLHLVRIELKSEMKAGFRQMDSRFSAMESKFAGIDSKFASMDSKFASMESRFASMESKFAGIDSKFASVESKFAGIDSKFADLDSKLERVLSEIARIGVLVEEQHSKNRITLEGLAGLWQRQDRVETRVDEVEKMVRSITRSKSS